MQHSIFICLGETLYLRCKRKCNQKATSGAALSNSNIHQTKIHRVYYVSMMFYYNHNVKKREIVHFLVCRYISCFAKM